MFVSMCISNTKGGQTTFWCWGVLIINNFLGPGTILVCISHFMDKIVHSTLISFCIISSLVLLEAISEKVQQRIYSKCSAFTFYIMVYFILYTNALFHSECNLNCRLNLSDVKCVEHCLINAISLYWNTVIL